MAVKKQELKVLSSNGVHKLAGVVFVPTTRNKRIISIEGDVIYHNYAYAKQNTNHGNYPFFTLNHKELTTHEHKQIYRVCNNASAHENVSKGQ